MNLLTRATGLIHVRRRADAQADRAPAPKAVPAAGDPVPGPRESRADNTWQGRPASLGDFFFGRDVELARLASALKNMRAVAICGPLGVGKTRLAAEFTSRSAAPGFWTIAGPTVDATFAGLAPALFLPTRGKTDAELASDVRRLLEALPDSTVWVIDGLDGPDQLEHIVAACGDVKPIVTMHDDPGDSLPEGYGRIRLDALTDDAAVAMLASKNPDAATDPAALELAAYVGKFPVGLELLASALRKGKPGGDLIARLRKHSVRATFGPYAGDETGFSDHLITAALLGLRSLPDSVRRHISPLAYVAEAPVSRSLVMSLVALEGDELLDLFRELGRRSLLSWHGDSLEIQPAVTAAIPLVSGVGGVGGTLKRAVGARKGDEALGTALRRAADRLKRAARKPGAALRSDLPHYQRLLDHCRVSPALAGAPAVPDFGSELAAAYNALGRPLQAVDLLEDSLIAREESLGIEHPGTFAARNNLAAAYHAAGRVPDAIALHEKTFAEAERVLGPDHETTVQSRQALAMANRAAGRITQAVPLYEKAVRTREKTLGPEHPDTLASRNMLASAYQAAGRVHEAVPIYERTLALRSRILGENHPDTVATRANLATAYQAVGRLGDALQLYEGALQVRVEMYGEDDRRTLTVQNNLATAYHTDGRLSQAMKIYEQTLETRSRTLGDAHMSTLTSRNNLASARRAMGNLRDALMMYEQNVEDRTRILGPEHPKTLTSMNNVAAVRSEVGNVEDAIPAFEAVLAVAERALGKTHPITVTCTANLASAYRAVGRYGDARMVEGQGDEDPDR